MRLPEQGQEQADMTRPLTPEPWVGGWTEGTQPSPLLAWSSAARSKDNPPIGPCVGVIKSLSHVPLLHLYFVIAR